MENRSPKVIGFLQATGLGAYIAVFAALAFQMRTWVEANAISIHPVIGITLFLLAFVISALISGSAILAYPAMLFFNGRKEEAIRILFWSAVWLLAVFAAAAGGALALRW